ncbi:glycosyltransferase [Vibrio sp. 03_296]|uniref:glycosyltransferase n=1 Tax=Vibrio sp. 03_296 TaxID=2024409 RepID=UPI002D7EDF26|nr:glycosyltransferase [Vibrio sp. 03_296]
MRYCTGLNCANTLANASFFDKGAGIRVQTIRYLVKLFRQFSPDVVHTHHIGPLLYGGLAARLSGVACRIHTEHDGWHLTQTKNALLQTLALKLVATHLGGRCNRSKTEH